MSFKTAIAAIIGFMLVAFVVIIWPFAIVNAGSRGVVVTFGRVDDEILQEGFHFISPMSDVIEMKVQTQKIETEANAASKDLQTVQSTVALNYHLDPEAVNKLYQEIGKGYEETVIAPAIQEAVKAATAQFTAEELITKRAEVGVQIQTTLISKLTADYILVESVSIVNFNFSPEFNSAVEAKVTAEQNALAAKNKLEQVKYEAEQRIAEAQGEAEAIRIQSEAVTSQGGAEYVKLKWIEAWQAGGSQVPSVVTDGGNFLLNLQP